MSSGTIRVGPIADGKHASLTVQVDPTSGLPVSGGGGGGVSDPAIVTNLEEIKNQIQSRLAAPITAANRATYDAQTYQSQPLILSDTNDRKAVRINNIVGNGDSQPVQGTAYLFVGNGFDPDRTSFDQVVLPGESILVDAPSVATYIRSDSLDPMVGIFNVVEYF
jgi:hypothetical protein